MIWETQQKLRLERKWHSKPQMMKKLRECTVVVDLLDQVPDQSGAVTTMLLPRKNFAGFSVRVKASLSC